MRPDDLIRPISPDAPCGPDLLAEDDDAFLDYYFNVEDRLPTSYYNISRGTLFDPRSIDQRAESAQIDALLARSRDLRLLVIEAKFQILSGRLKGFATALEGIARVLETFPAEVHPRIAADSQDRRNAIEELNTLAGVVHPLEYATLFTDRRAGDILYRAYATGSGKLPLRENEEPGDAGLALQALSSSDNTEEVDGLFRLLSGMLEAVARITTICQTGPHPFVPRLDRLTERIGDMIAMVQQARPDLGGSAPAAPPAAAGAPAGAAAAPAGALPAAAPLPPLAVPTHAAARAVLEQVGRYFARFEPGALSMVLVTQARLLIGRPLVEALDVLMESSADGAMIEFGTEGFRIPMSRMRMLSEEGGSTALEDDEAEPFAAPQIQSREQVAEALKGVEEFFRLREPASPVPILLFKARNLLNKDFHAIVRELLPPDAD